MNAGFLSSAPETPAVTALYDVDVADDGYVMNLTRVWAHRPDLNDLMKGLIGAAGEALSVRERGILVCSVAATIDDSYCALAWGNRLAEDAGEDVAHAVLTGDNSLLDPREVALAQWARQVAQSPAGSSAQQVALLRDAGYDDATILTLTVYVAARIAFASVNDALGAQPDRELLEAASPQVVAAVQFGRPVA